MELIDKDVLVAEIKSRLLPVAAPYGTNYDDWDRGANNERLNILSLIDTLEVKEVDLEKELEDWLGERVGKWTGKECERMCRYFFELGLKAQKGE